MIADSDRALQVEPPRELPRVGVEASARAVSTPSEGPNPNDEATRAMEVTARVAEIAPPVEPQRVAASEPPVESVRPAEIKHPVVDVPPISSTLPADSGLEIVETRFKVAPESEPEPDPAGPRRVRPPRVAIPDEPLQIVETRKDEQPPAG